MYRSSPCVRVVLGHAILAIFLTAKAPAQFTLEQTSPAWISNPVELSAQGATPGSSLFLGISGALQDPPAPIAGGLYMLDPIVVVFFGTSNPSFLSTVGRALIMK